MTIHKFFVLTGLGLAIIVIIIGLTSLLVGQRTIEQDNVLFPTPITTRNQTFTVPFRVAISEPLKKYNLVLSTASPVTLFFTQPISPKSLKYEIDPKVEIFTEIDATRTKLTFKPEVFWKPEILYTLTIKEVKSQDKKDLPVPYKIQFKAVLPSGEDEGASAEANNNP